jgi:nucleotide-binding universal stress UspA family protein
MNRILVPTDFSTNSVAGIQFAMHLANVTGAELEFIYVSYLHTSVYQLAHVTEESVDTDKEKSTYLSKLETFVSAIYAEMDIPPKKHVLQVIQGVRADSAILNYTEKHQQFDYICISSKGAGSIDRIFGTNTGNLVTKSIIPVIVVPQLFKVSTITKIIYASDLLDFEIELKKVLAFAKPMRSAVEIVHFAPDITLVPDEYINQDYNKKYEYGLSFHFEKTNPLHTLLRNLRDKITDMRPSLLVLFTKQDRSFFQKLFLSSVAEGLSFQAIVPMLIINKTKKVDKNKHL